MITIYTTLKTYIMKRARGGQRKQEQSRVFLFEERRRRGARRKARERWFGIWGGGGMRRRRARTFSNDEVMLIVVMKEKCVYPAEWVNVMLVPSKMQSRVSLNLRVWCVMLSASRLSDVPAYILSGSGLDFTCLMSGSICYYIRLLGDIMNDSILLLVLK